MPYHLEKALGFHSLERILDSSTAGSDNLQRCHLWVPKELRQQIDDLRHKLFRYIRVVKLNTFKTSEEPGVIQSLLEKRVHHFDLDKQSAIWQKKTLFLVIPLTRSFSLGLRTVNHGSF